MVLVKKPLNGDNFQLDIELLPYR